MHTHRRCCVTQCIPGTNHCGKIPHFDRTQSSHPSSCGVRVVQEEKELDSHAAQLEQEYRDDNKKKDFWLKIRHIKSI